MLANSAPCTVEYSRQSICSHCSLTATAHCLACDSSLCPHCLETHRANPRFARHKVTESVDGSPVCRLHKALLELYCVNEFQFLCAQCVETDWETHCKHEVLTVLQARVALRHEMDNYRKYCEEVIGKLEDYRFCYVEARAMVEEKYWEVFDTKVGEMTSRIGRLCEVAKERDGLVFLSQIEDATHIDFDSLKIAPSDLDPPTYSSVHLSLACCNDSLPSDPIYMLYIERGTPKFSRYNIITQRSENLELPKECFPRWSILTPLSNVSCVVTGGKPNKDSGGLPFAFVLHYEHNTVEELPNMISGHSSHVAVMADDRLYVCGGKNANNVTHRQCEFLEWKTQTWVSAAPMVVDRTCASGVRHLSSLYLFGGYRNDVENSIEHYSLPLDCWTLLPSKLPENLWQHNSWVISRNQILIFGGEKLDDEAHRLSYLWNVDTGKFEKYAEVTVKSSWLVSWMHVVKRGNCLFVLGKDTQVVKYAISRNKWSVEV